MKVIGIIKPRAWLVLLLALALIWPASLAGAQEEDPEGPVYIVQEGDTLFDIAQRFGVNWLDLANANDIGDAGQISVGQGLVIPGLAGVQGILVSEQIFFGENLRSLSRRYAISREELARLNRLVSSQELFVGVNLIIPAEDADTDTARRVTMASGESLLEQAVVSNANPWTLAKQNALPGTWAGVPGDVLRIPGGDDGVAGPGALPGEIAAVEVDSLPLVQGKTTVIHVQGAEGLELGGGLIDHELHFFEDQSGNYVALQGVHALQEPGFYPLSLRGMTSNGALFDFSQRVYVSAGDYGFETLVVPPETIDPANTRPEDELWYSLPLEFTPERLWEGILAKPASSATGEDCYSSYFGNRRSYNGSPYNYFHTGLDFCYNYTVEENEIRAPADGVVVYTGELTVRGNATMIDHGWGVYTGYMHQTEIIVEPGEQVETGQVIGIAGKTGRVSGPHLHLEVWVGGVQVDPLDWLERAYP